METMVKNYFIFKSNYSGPYRYENRLEALAAKGWILEDIEGNFRHTFVKGKPKKIRFFQDNVKISINESPYYKQLFKDDGWTLVYSSPPFYLWSKEYDEVRPEPNTEIERIKRLIKNLSWTLAFLIILDLTNFIMRIPLGTQWDILPFMIIFTLILGTYPFIYLIKNLKKLRNLELK